MYIIIYIYTYIYTFISYRYAISPTSSFRTTIIPCCSCSYFDGRSSGPLGWDKGKTHGIHDVIYQYLLQYPPLDKHGNGQYLV